MGSIPNRIILLILCKFLIKPKKNWSFQRICILAPQVIGMESLGYSWVVHLPVQPLNQHSLYGELQPGGDYREDLQSREVQPSVYLQLRQPKISLTTSKIWHWTSVKALHYFSSVRLAVLWMAEYLLKNKAPVCPVLEKPPHGLCFFQ